MSLDAPVSAQDALLQRYFDGTLSETEAEAFEADLDRDPALAESANAYSGVFAALEMRGLEFATPDLAASAVAAWAPSFALRPTLILFAALDIVLGATLASVLVSQGPATAFSSWVLGLKDLLVVVHNLTPAPEQAALGVVAALGAVVLLLGATGYGLGRLFLGSGARA